MKTVLDRLITFQLDYPKRVLTIIAIITAAAMGTASRVQFDFTIENLFPENDPEVDAYFEFREEFEREDDLISLAYDAGDPFSRENLLSTRMLTEAFSKIEGISEVTSLTNVELFEPGENLVMAAVYRTVPGTQDSLDLLKGRVMSSQLLTDNLVSSDGKTAAFILELDDDVNNHEGRERVIKVMGEISASTAWKWYEAGIPILRTRYVQYMLDDYGRFFVPVTIVLFGILFLLFRTLRGVLLPFSAVLIADFWALGIMGALGLTINIVTYIVPTLVLIIGVADSIHILVKFHEELIRGRDKREAIRITVQKIGSAIMLTSVTTSVGFLSLVSTNITMIREFGAIVAVAVIFAFIVSITFIPAMLVILKMPSEAKLQRVTRSLRHRFLKWVVSMNNRHQTPIVVVSSLLVFTFIFYA
ncbi:MAG: efflux RND transporter permease subunit, partial [Candidatus Marinimicrobia bacterium]|nr:efflux RND transporter permease subunit [Candidatus Neomarinimicrobiota bacterium]